MRLVGAMRIEDNCVQPSIILPALEFQLSNRSTRNGVCDRANDADMTGTHSLG